MTITTPFFNSKIIIKKEKKIISSSLLLSFLEAVTEKEKLINPSLPISTTHLSPPAATILNAISPPIPAIN
ncbi:hypothetical protein V6N13_053111 [Hibiscus sabdariffa]